MITQKSAAGDKVPAARDSKLKGVMIHDGKMSTAQLRCVIGLCSCLYTFVATTSVWKTASKVTNIPLSFAFLLTVFSFLHGVNCGVEP